MNVLRKFWHPVSWSKDLTDKPLSVKLLDQPVVLWRVNETVSAFYDLCLHRGAALSLGWIDGDKLVCPYHGWNYGADGACVIEHVQNDHAVQPLRSVQAVVPRRFQSFEHGAKN